MVIVTVIVTAIRTAVITTLKPIFLKHTHTQQTTIDTVHSGNQTWQLNTHH